MHYLPCNFVQTFAVGSFFNTLHLTTPSVAQTIVNVGINNVLQRLKSLYSSLDLTCVDIRKKIRIGPDPLQKSEMFCPVWKSLRIM